MAGEDSREGAGQVTEVRERLDAAWTSTAQVADELQAVEKQLRPKEER